MSEPEDLSWGYIMRVLSGVLACVCISMLIIAIPLTCYRLTYEQPIGASRPLFNLGDMVRFSPDWKIGEIVDRNYNHRVNRPDCWLYEILVTDPNAEDLTMFRNEHHIRREIPE